MIKNVLLLLFQDSKYLSLALVLPPPCSSQQLSNQSLHPLTGLARPGSRQHSSCSSWHRRAPPGCCPSQAALAVGHSMGESTVAASGRGGGMHEGKRSSWSATSSPCGSMASLTGSLVVGWLVPPCPALPAPAASFCLALEAQLLLSHYKSLPSGWLAGPLSDCSSIRPHSLSPSLHLVHPTDSCLLAAACSIGWLALTGCSQPVNQSVS